MINLLKHCALTYFTKNTYWENTPEIVWSDDNKASTDKIRGYNVTLVLRDGDEENPFILVPKTPKKWVPHGLIKVDRQYGGIVQKIYINATSLNRVRVSVDYYLNGSRYSAENCSVLKLIQMVLLKKFGLMYLYILYRKLADRITRWKVSRRLRKVNELTKFELYECMILCQSRAGVGTVRVRDLIAVLSGETSTMRWPDIYVGYRSKVTSLLDNYMNEGEVSGGNDHYALTGKGMSRFAEEKEKARHNKKRAFWGLVFTVLTTLAAIGGVVAGFKCELSEAEWVKSIAPTAMELVAKQCKP
uniref:Transmembrane protein n=2 Tax=Vibrio TaxID=662 RepID=A0A0H3ZSZ2_9VIBR|nr:hypothetical protein [Vibrio cyclitrophicus]AKN38272.1 hypothetical protein [Vibrio splendidus]